mgnify:CR=1 FL=1
MNTELVTKHLCRRNWYKDTEIRFEKINAGQESWVLEQTRYASKKDVIDGLSNQEGKPVNSNIILINYCPFCGEDLTKKKMNTW